MEHTIREIIAQKGLAIEETDYRGSPAEMLDFRLFAGDFYEPIGGKLRFKECVTVMDFRQVTEEWPFLADVTWKGREKFPYFTDNLDGLLAARDRGEAVAVEGGPCLFGEHEVVVTVRLKDGEERRFDYSTGKTYLKEQPNEKDGAAAEADSLAQYLRRSGDRTAEISFRQEKSGLTPQEYLNLRCPFEIAARLGGPLVIPIPDMSYRKYFVTALEFTPEPLRSAALAEFDGILSRIADLFLEAVQKLQDHFQIEPFACVHLRTPELLETWYQRRTPYIERHKILRGLTRIPEKTESVKDYISMPALPFYLFGTSRILEVCSVDEADSYRKCRKAHRKDTEMGAILLPELLSGDGVHTVYNAPLPWKDYGNYDDSLPED